MIDRSPPVLELQARAEVRGAFAEKREEAVD
jgi:hypothetical protein